MTHHYLTERKSADKVTASILATEKSIMPIITSGFILAVAGYGVFFMSSVNAIGNLGHMIGRGALLSMILVIALLPNLFVWADKLLILSESKTLSKKIAQKFCGKMKKYSIAKEED
ncbi:MAG: MMPL family transporter, partial [Eubacteriales bacterium]|nr:MMPL family transporter [Eubacteriales bacterium]